ncbi:MAG: hypothetical protein H0V92_09575 [Pseudonocardiales bacterium]|nr:hypothetical protein [Pseudonocardiales bacterium]
MPSAQDIRAWCRVCKADEQVADLVATVRARRHPAVAPELPDSWWQAMVRSLDALVVSRPTRVATVDSTPITQERISAAVFGVFGDVDTEVVVWGGVHADLNWANVTAPELSILDWEDYGRGPVGLDHASLWSASLAVASLSARVEAEFADILSTPTGRVCRLFYLASCCRSLLITPERCARPLKSLRRGCSARLGNASVPGADLVDR